jgi:multidrug efflux pump subunit AcrA (membrane-fusion protein)
MGAVMKSFKRLKPWQIVGLSALMAVVVVAALGASTLSGRGGAQQLPPIEGSKPMANIQQPTMREIPVNGHLVFSDRAELTFGTSGEVGEILVQEGEQVEEGQELVRLDSLTVTALEESRARPSSTPNKPRMGWPEPGKPNLPTLPWFRHSLKKR